MGPKNKPKVQRAALAKRKRKKMGEKRKKKKNFSAGVKGTTREG